MGKKLSEMSLEDLWQGRTDELENWFTVEKIDVDTYDFIKYYIEYVYTQKSKKLRQYRMERAMLKQAVLMTD